MGNFPKATRPLEYVGLFQADMATTQDGDVFAFIAVDMFSMKVFFTGAEPNRDNETVIKHTKLLLQDKDFIWGMKEHGSFTLVYHKFTDIVPLLNDIVKPYGGNIMVSDAFVTMVVLPVVEQLFKTIAKKQ